MPTPSNRLRRQDAAGGAHPQFMVEATDEDHHGVVIYSELVAAGCVLGKTDKRCIARGSAPSSSEAPSTTSQDGRKPIPSRARRLARQPVPGPRRAGRRLTPGRPAVTA